MANMFFSPLSWSKFYVERASVLSNTIPIWNNILCPWHLNEKLWNRKCQIMTPEDAEWGTLVDPLTSVACQGDQRITWEKDCGKVNSNCHSALSSPSPQTYWCDLTCSRLRAQWGFLHLLSATKVCTEDTTPCDNVRHSLKAEGQESRYFSDKVDYTIKLI